LKQGDGRNFPSKGTIVKIHYDGKLESGTVFDSSRKRGVPFSFKLGVGQVIKGMDEVVNGMSLGERVIATIPPDMGYGARGAGPIPPNANLIFDIELLSMS